MPHTASSLLSIAALLALASSSADALVPNRPVAPTVAQRIDHRFDCGQVKDPERAIAGCRALIASNSEDGRAHLALGLAYERNGEGGEALNAFIAATSVGYRRTEANREDGEAWYLIAVASQGAARVCADEPDMRKDFEDAAREAAHEAAARGIRVPDLQ